MGRASREYREGRRGSSGRKRTDGDINIDYVPNEKGGKGKKGFKGGDYVDYEEVS